MKIEFSHFIKNVYNVEIKSFAGKRKCNCEKHKIVIFMLLGLVHYVMICSWPKPIFAPTFSSFVISANVERGVVENSLVAVREE